MKYIIASDIHGSAQYCGQLLEAFEREGADKLLLLGDILYHGPRNDLPGGHAPKEASAMLNAMADKIICVRGNCEAEVDQAVLDFPCMADYSIIEANELMLFATHGHLFNPVNPPKMRGDYVLLNGHTHVPACEQFDNFWYMNPGSVSLPKGGSERGYILLDSRTFTWKTLTGEAYQEQTI